MTKVMQNTITTLSKLPLEKVAEVATFAEFVLKQYEEEVLQNGGKSLQKKFDLAEMVSRMPSDYAPHEEDFGKPVGKEVW